MEERILKSEYSEVMQKSFIDYAMSVIIARALPDVRDGLKPVQRRTLYDMYELGIRYDKPYRKCARIVGDTMGKYHPHGDGSIYEALVVMAQDFKKGLPLVDGHGNFGTIEGDGAAAMRYTEARLERIAQDGLLADLDKDVVDFVPNFDETEKEPSILPAKFPNLLINGSEGIAVGMSTSVPPHNFAEVADATKVYLNNPDITVKELMRYIPGPDFPTGGIICNQDDLQEIYETGTGKIKIRGRVQVEKQKNGRLNIVVTEIPYTMIGSGIAKFLQDVAALAESRKTNEIVDISNQSSKDGIRIVIEVRKDTDTENFINMLYKKTRLEDTFGVNMLAIKDGRPEVLSLKEIIAANVDFQFEFTRRKYTTLLNKEMEKKEVQEGLIKACNVIDLIIEILRGSRDRNMAKNCLVNGETKGIKFKNRGSEIMASQLCFTERQANAILEMRLYKLIGLELEALIKEHEETLTNIYRYEDILARRDAMAQVIIQDMEGFKKDYKKPRRTTIENAKEAVFVEKKAEEIDLYVMLDRFGYIRAVDEATYERNKEAAISENRFVFSCKNTGKVCLFTDKGQMHTLKASDIPFGKFRDKAQPVDNISAYSSQNESIVFAASQTDINLYRLCFITAQGMGKIVNGGEFDVARKTVSATKLQDNDTVVSVAIYKDQKHIVLKSKDGCFLRFSMEEIPEKKKTAVGVRVMKLKPEDVLDEVWYLKYNDNVLITYKDKELDLSRIKLGKRDGGGVKVRV
ncbi:MAG: DNA topoisomerase 4 subunit A [Lachnospiraceae bacterium]|nr:DNA topoisomerase 4 subunit A [Lachnospiraceae bacterium]